MSILKPPPRNPLEILDDQVIQEARLFVDYHIRPGIFNLLATNKDRFDQLQVLQDMSKHIESIGPSLTGHLSHFNPNQNQLNYIEANFSEMVFPHADRKRFAVFVQPLLIRHFIFWRHLKIREMEDKIAAPECVFINVVSQSELPNKQLEQLCDAAKHFLGLLSSAPFGANLADPAVLAYDSLARGYAKSFLDGFGEILLDDRFIEANDETHRNSTMKGVFTILHEWLIEIGLSEVDAHVVADEAAIYVKKGVIDILIERIFRLTVVEFPQKHRSLKTLCAYMNETKQHGREVLTQLLIEQLRHRLLRMDIDTKEILEAYAKCVESLKEVDPSNVIMLIVCDVIKDYLQKRPDTVRQIITYITCQENRTEMEKNWRATNEGAMVNEKDVDGFNDEFFPKAFDMANWRLWQPDPLDAPKESGRIRQSSDMFNMLVQIYGSKMKFLDEYQKLMAERIINSPFTDRDELFEKSCLHSLSMRFSPNELNKCDVMLRDLEVSRLLDQQVAESDVPVAIASKIISSHYWPKITAEHLEHLGSDRLEEAIKMYEERFVAEKPERYIKWIRAKGTIEMEFDLGDGVSITKPVPTIYAQIIFQFQEKEEWLVDEISEKLKLTKEHTEAKLEWWTNKGMLVKKSNTLYALSDDSSRLAQFVAEKSFTEEYEEESTPIEENSETIDALFDDFWKYIRQLVEQTGGQTSQELFRKIKMMVPDSNFEQFNIYMAKKVSTDQICIDNGVYKIINEGTTAFSI